MTSHAGADQQLDRKPVIAAPDPMLAPAFLTRIPEPSATAVVRQKRLATSACQLILAPAGFGKSCYLQQQLQSWQQHHNGHALWLALDGRHDDPAMLLLALARANGQPDLALAEHPDPHASLLFWLDSLSVQNQPILLCIDDIQHLRSLAGWQWLTALIQHRPACLQLLLAGRYLPHPLGKLQLLPELQILPAVSLLLDEAQVQGWLQGQEKEIVVTLAKQLEATFSGWPAAIAIWLACYRAAGKPGNASPALARAALEDYWQGEFLPDLSDTAADLASLLAMLEGADKPWLNDVLGGDCASALSRLQHLGLATDVDGWWSLTPALRWLLNTSLVDDKRREWQKASFQWLSTRNQPVQALQHARQADELESLAPWVESHAESILASLDFSGLVHWCEMAGDALLCCSPRLMQIASWGWLLTWRLKRADSMIRQLLQRQSLREPELLALQGYLARLRGNPRSAHALCQRAWQELPEKRAGVRFLMASTLTYLALGDTDLDNARRWNRHALEITRQFDMPALEALALFDQARIELHRGHIDHALVLVEKGIQRCHFHGQDDGLAMGRLLLYRVFLLWISGREAAGLEPLLEQGIDCCRRHQDVLVCYGYGLLAMLAAAEGRPARALDCIDDAECLMQQWGVDLDSYRWLILVKANVWISQGKFERASDCLDELLQGQTLHQLPRADVFPMLPDFAAATRARLYLASAQYEACLAEVDEWLRCHSSPMIMLLVQLIRGAALRGCQQLNESNTLFANVAERLQKEGVSLSFAAWLPEIYTPSADVCVSQSGSQRIQLSEREHDVLRKISEGLSNEEIAARLYISLHTVKSHARRINVKLGVRNRTQAIHKARALLLL